MRRGRARILSAMFVVALAVVFAAIGHGQTKTFRWDTELCEFSGTYNSRKYTETQLRNTVRLMRQGELSLGVTDATVWNHDEIPKLDIAKLDRDYERVKRELTNLVFVKTPFWEAVRQAKLRETEQIYRLSRATMQAYTRPEVLRAYQGAERCKAGFAEPIIAGGESLLEAWRRVNEDSRSKNADPERLRRIFEQQMASPDRLKFALIETMAFGWWNCANEFIEYDSGANNETREREFRKLFIRVRKIRCDEP